MLTSSHNETAKLINIDLVAAVYVVIFSTDLIYRRFFGSTVTLHYLMIRYATLLYLYRIDTRLPTIK